MDLKVKYKQVSSPSEAFDIVKSKLESGYLDQFKIKADIEYRETNNEIKAKGKGFDLLVNFYQDRCEIKIDLGLLLKPLKSRILSKLEGLIGENL